MSISWKELFRTVLTDEVQTTMRLLGVNRIDPKFSPDSHSAQHKGTGLANHGSHPSRSIQVIKGQSRLRGCMSALIPMPMEISKHLYHFLNFSSHVFLAVGI